jgi:hypothetical protein
MDLSVAWYQEEQEGEAKRIWSNIWETAEMVRSFDSYLPVSFAEQ